jgi:hypothetical protein
MKMRLPSHKIRFDLADSCPAGCCRDNALPSGAALPDGFVGIYAAKQAAQLDAIPPPMPQYC